MKNVIVGTAGHIDHGKSALVEALTGTHPDRLEEEKRRGITIDLGFAFLDLGEVRLGFVDVPGHERFVKNMLAGAGGFDLVLLVIAADEGIKPQTREHFDICRLLGIPRGLVAMTKCDLVDKEAVELVRLEAEEFLRASFLEGAPIVAASVKTGAGLQQVRDALLRVAQAAPPRDAGRHFRLPIDRVFAMKGFGAVVTGTLVSGSVKPGDEVELFPSRKRVRVRGVQSGGKTAQRADAGQRTALNLAAVELDELKRGMTLAAPGVFEDTRCVDSRLTLLASARPLKSHARVHFHQGTSECVAEAVLLDRAQLAPGESCFAQLQMPEAMLLLPGDRFIIRQFSPVVTIGGGAVLNNHGSPQARKDAGLASLLAAMERGSREEILSALCAGQPAGLAQRQIIARTGWLAAEVQETAQKLMAAGKVRVLAGTPESEFVVVGADELKATAQAVKAEVEKSHAANPLSPGISKEELRERVTRRAEENAVFRAALEELVAARELTLAGDLVKRAGREISLTPEEARAKEQIEQAFARAGLTVPSVKEVLGKLAVEEKRAQKILQMLLRERVLVKVSEDLIFHRSAMEELRAKLAAYKKQNGERLPIAAFKELSGVSRKYAIPLLEYLDRERVTRRVGDARVIQ
ncbi:MAG: selenocysteine-specific translation elongation factor [Acidobacteria bacterium]|nr:selenocysteine-specific translation elongation factor [Acidobacteriota bacterium]